LSVLQDEAAKLGCEVWEIDRVKAKLAEAEKDSDDSDDSKEETKEMPKVNE